MQKNSFFLFTKEESEKLSSFFQVFSDSTRLNILFLLSEKELCSGEIAKEMEMTPSAISHQLKILKDHHLLRVRRDGKMLCYRLADAHIDQIIKMGLEHIRE